MTGRRVAMTPCECLFRIPARVGYDRPILWNPSSLGCAPDMSPGILLRNIYVKLRFLAIRLFEKGPPLSDEDLLCLDHFIAFLRRGWTAFRCGLTKS